MAFPSDRTFLIGPFLDWWDKRSAKRDDRHTERLARRRTRLDAPDEPPKMKHFPDA